jgi:iron complex outermembrane receptor protein
MKRTPLVVAILLSAVAFAKPPADPKAQEAREHFKSGMAHFNLQEYKDAIPDFEAAYRLVPDAVFLYNLAQAHRLAENPERALYFYRAYLRASPDAPNRGEVDGRIATLEKLLAEKQNLQKPPDSALAPGEKPEATPANTTTVAVEQPAPEKKTPIYKKWWLWTIVGVVVAGTAVGLGVGLTQHGSSFNAPLGTVGPSALGVH